MAKVCYGVFLVGRAWKFYREHDRALSFDNRADAISAANGALRDATAKDREIELYVQDAAGGFVSTNPSKAAH